MNKNQQKGKLSFSQLHPYNNAFPYYIHSFQLYVDNFHYYYCHLSLIFLLRHFLTNSSTLCKLYELNVINFILTISLSLIVFFFCHFLFAFKLIDTSLLIACFNFSLHVLVNDMEYETSESIFNINSLRLLKGRKF